MRHRGISDFLRRAGAALAPGPVAVVLAEDAVAVGATLRHHRAAGFRRLILLAHPDLALPDLAPDHPDATDCHRIDADVFAPGALCTAVNRLIAAAPDTWFLCCHNAEFLFFPFAETRTVRDLLAFQAEERRDATLSVVVDLYAADLDRHPDAVSLERALFDRAGYYALDRPDPARPGAARDRQIDLFGGLRWRFEDHIPPDRRRIDRIALFRARKGLEMRPDHSFNVEEYNTHACPWHRSVTTAICSFRTAKALRTNPGSAAAITTFRWPWSEPFAWRAQQLMDHGLMEPGQWF